jgi:hypothetical protein
MGPRPESRDDALERESKEGRVITSEGPKHPGADLQEIGDRIVGLRHPLEPCTQDLECPLSEGVD